MRKFEVARSPKCVSQKYENSLLVFNLYGQVMEDVFICDFKSRDFTFETASRKQVNI
jgi:hypothetical protein